MPIKAFVQKGRGKPGLILPANAVNAINESKDRSALIRAAEYAAAKKQPASVETAVPPTPRHVPDTVASEAPTPEPAVEVAQPERIETPEPERAEPGESSMADEAREDDLTALSGIGPTLQQRLYRFGFKTFEAIAKANPDTLNEVPGVKGRGVKFVELASQRIADGQ